MTALFAKLEAAGLILLDAVITVGLGSRGKERWGKRERLSTANSPA